MCSSMNDTNLKRAIQKILLSFTWQVVVLCCCIFGEYSFASFPEDGVCTQDFSQLLVRIGAQEALIKKIDNGHLTFDEYLDMSNDEAVNIAGLSLEEAQLVLKHLCRIYECQRNCSLSSSASSFRDLLELHECNIPGSVKQQSLHIPESTYFVPDGLHLYSSYRWLLMMAAFKGYRGELYNCQRLALMELMYLTKSHALGWGLVEPVFIFNPRNAAVYEMLEHRDPTLLSRLSPSFSEESIVWQGSTVRTSYGIFASPAGTLHEMSILSKFLGFSVLPYRDFVKYSKGVIDHLLINAPHLAGPQPQLRCEHPANNVELELLGRPWVVKSFHCNKHQQTGTIIPDFTASTSNPLHRSLGLVYSKGSLHSDAEGLRLLQHHNSSFQYFRTRSFLRFSRAVFAYALAYLRDELQGQPFVAVHWRRGDRLIWRSPELTVDWTVVVERAAQVCRAEDVALVFLLTDCGTAADIAHIVDALWRRHGIAVRRLPSPLRAYAGAPVPRAGAAAAAEQAAAQQAAAAAGQAGEQAGAWREEDVRVAAEIAAAAFAERVVVSVSTVSVTLVEERVLLGFDALSYEYLTPVRDASVVEFHGRVMAILSEMHAGDAGGKGFGRAVRAQGPVGRQAMECVREAAETVGGDVGNCVGMVMDSAHAIADALS